VNANAIASIKNRKHAHAPKAVAECMLKSQKIDDGQVTQHHPKGGCSKAKKGVRYFK